jgi:hypothetical protein
MKRFCAILVISAVFCALFSMLIKYEYCIAGDGQGFPCAIIHPGHGPSIFEFVYEGEAIEGMVFDALSLGLNFLFWSILAGLPLAILDRRKQLRQLKS